MGHLEQMVNNFFPYSQKALNFDKPISIIFQSDEENASKMLGKTAYYDPEAMEVVLYTDNRHPKDILRSLSHELVHHAQNCRGDFHGGCDEEGGNNACVKDTGPGYAQRDPHLRKMEREAYTKGNLIFRDFEDLIKTGKINIEIDFSDSGEPKMSLNEWKNNELNTLLMKKWRLLKEDSRAEEPRHAADNIRDDQKHIKNLKSDEKDDEKELEETRVDLARSRGQLHKTIDPEAGEDPELAQAYGVGPDEDDPEPWRKGRVAMKALSGLDDPRLKRNPTPEYSDTVVKPRAGSRSASLVRGAPRENQELPRKISVREAKEITRRIIERIRKEAK
jgi:hypothetical protein